MMGERTNNGNNEPLLKISGLVVDYLVSKYEAGGSLAKSYRAVDNISLEIPSTHYTLGVVGESGSGKTTLGLSMLNVIEVPGKIISGRIEYYGRNILEINEKELRDYRWKEVSMVFQSAMNSLNPVKKISDHVTEVIGSHEKISKKVAKERAVKLLESVGIPGERCEDYAHQFSGGMRQRAVIAMSLALSPKLLIADEPTSALDVVVQKAILKLLKRKVAESGLSLILITHELAILNGLVENIAVMHAGKMVEMGPAIKILQDPIHPYTQMIVSSVLSMKSDPYTLKERTMLLKEKKSALERILSTPQTIKEVQKGRWVAC